MTLKRTLDVAFSGMSLIVFSPLLAAVAGAIYLCDFHNPLYIAPRVGRNGRTFHMVKFRSMVVNADRTGVTSTSAADPRVTPVGRFVRRFKLDEILQLWNVLRGDMSLVGPRPNVPSGVALYTTEERHLLEVRPGITDFSSIVFADEGEILKAHVDPDVAYDQLIRPWKSRLGIFYIEHSSVPLDLRLIFWTAVAMVSRRKALQRVHDELVALRAPVDLTRVALRLDDLRPPPPGAAEVVTSRL